MPRLAWSWAIPLLLVGSAAAAQRASLGAQMSLAMAPEEHVCAGAFAPQGARDASDALFFATGPTSRLDQHEMWAGGLAPLVAARWVAGALNLVVLGVPTQTQLRFTEGGWRPRWPFC